LYDAVAITVVIMTNCIGYYLVVAVMYRIIPILQVNM